MNLTVDALVLAALSTASWEGVYHFEVVLGQTNAGLNAWVEYQLNQVGEPLLRLIQREDSVVTEWKAIQPNFAVQQTTYCFERKEKSWSMNFSHSYSFPKFFL